MTSKLREDAESRFAALLRKDTAAMNSVEEQQRAMREKTERLRSLRLAHQAEITSSRTSLLKAKRRAQTTL
ncbi:hypothetical protein [Pelagibacterium halotolerans]|uniref:hypothetical protein n=1 Tax=Pelagibacterium halotolerans TaxID=531813 RepID=UPI00384ECBE6